MLRGQPAFIADTQNAQFILRGKAKCAIWLHSLLKFKDELRRVWLKMS
jgi:hypothetical protein